MFSLITFHGFISRFLFGCIHHFLWCSKHFSFCINSTSISNHIFPVNHNLWKATIIFCTDHLGYCSILSTRIRKVFTVIWLTSSNLKTATIITAIKSRTATTTLSRLQRILGYFLNYRYIFFSILNCLRCCKLLSFLIYGSILINHRYSINRHLSKTIHFCHHSYRPLSWISVWLSFCIKTTAKVSWVQT